MKKYYLVIASKEYPLVMEDGSDIEKIVLENNAIVGVANNIGGEIYFMTDIDIPFNGNEREIFNVGDIVYWRSQEENKFAIAIFYDNTHHGAGNAPTAASPCMKFATLSGNYASLASVDSGTHIRFVRG